MYIKNNKYYANAGYYLTSGVNVGSELPIELEDIIEMPVYLEDMEICQGGNTLVAVCSNDKVSFLVSNDGSVPTYASLKTDIIKSRYSNDDQIAIMLNIDNDTEESKLNYQRMQEWREYATNVAKKIMELYDERGTQSPSGEQQDVEADS